MRCRGDPIALFPYMLEVRPAGHLFVGSRSPSTFAPLAPYVAAFAVLLASSETFALAEVRESRLTVYSCTRVHIRVYKL